ncbi:MAG: ribonuclease H-like domain-containing protein [Ardenticatenaceae bacterium]|nr:ribonuclease H-like domain-containing protein [Ardenticatenaceae bacterium]
MADNMADNIVIFDLETQRDLDEVGGREFLNRVGVSVGVSYALTSHRFHHYLEHELGDLVAQLRAADLVVGFNIRAFDYPVLQAYTEFDLASLPTCDIMDHVRQALGHRVALDSLAQQTLGVRKSADGRMALRWWKDGQINLIRDYCQQDVDVTRRLYEFGRDHGYLWSWDRRTQQRVKIPVGW